MTVPSLPKRSSPDDDQLDAVLNAWVSGESHQRHSERSEESRIHELYKQNELAKDALEFHRWAEDVRQSESAARGPAADTWNRILRSTAQAKSRGEDMS